MLLKFFLWILRSPWDRGGSLKPRKPLPNSIWNCWICFCGLIETAEAASTVLLRPLKQSMSNKYLEFLCDFEAICEMVLAVNQNTLGWVHWWKKNWGSKISWHCQFKKLSRQTLLQCMGVRPGYFCQVIVWRGKPYHAVFTVYIWTVVVFVWLCYKTQLHTTGGGAHYGQIYAWSLVNTSTS
jgi:hypothetical protein